MTEQSKTARFGRSRMLLLIIAAIAFVPLFIASFVFFFFPELVPGTSNQGTLIQPPIQVNDPKLGIPGKWVMLISVEAECDATCERVLYLSRQVRIALGKDASRTQRVLLTAGSLSRNFLDLLAREHAQVTIVSLDRDTADTLRSLVKDDSAGGPVVFLMDPNGNIMMYYLSSQGGKPMLDDLKHLLKVSSIG